MTNLNNVNNQSPISSQNPLAAQGVKTLGELIQSQPQLPQFLVDGLLPSAGISILAGKPKDGKSTLVRQLIYCVAMGKDFLNYPVKQGPVLYLALEESEYWVTKHFVDMGASSGAPIHIVFAGKNNTNLPMLIHKLNPALVVIDPLFLYVDVKDGNSYTEVYKEMGKLTSMAAHYQTHILTVHHMKKGLSTGPDSMLGSQGLFGSVHTAIMFETRDNATDRVIHSKQKYGKHMKPTAISFDESTGIYTNSGSVQAQTELEVEVAIEDFIADAGGGVTQDEIIAATKIKRQTVIEVLGRLSNSTLGKSGLGVRGQPFKYSLKTDAADTNTPAQTDSGGVQ